GLLVHCPFSIFVSPDDLDIFLRHLLRCRAFESRVETELRLKGAGHALRSVYLSSNPITTAIRGGRILYQTAIVDLTERNRAAEAVLRLAAIVRSSRDAIAAKDLDGIVTDWNEGAERMFGYSRQEIVGKSIRMLIPPSRRREEDDILSRLRGGGSLDHYETVRRRKDGQLIDVSLTISPIRDNAGRIIGISKIARDITGQKNTQRQLNEQARLLELT